MRETVEGRVADLEARAESFRRRKKVCCPHCGRLTLLVCACLKMFATFPASNTLLEVETFRKEKRDYRLERTTKNKYGFCFARGSVSCFMLTPFYAIRVGNIDNNNKTRNPNPRAALTVRVRLGHRTVQTCSPRVSYFENCGVTSW